jgi:iron complex outermembrane receptor protein
MIFTTPGVRALQTFCAILLSTVSAVCHASPNDEPIAPSEQDRDVGARSGQVADIVVTARRVNESLQRVPIAVTGFDATTIRAMQIQNFGDVGKMVPNLEAQRQFGSASAPQFYLRGISTGSLKFETDAGIGLYIDGVYLGRPAGAAFDLADIERIEVLRGPQATLFGRNSTGGAINFVTSAPRGELRIDGEGTLGNYDRRRGRISVDLPAWGPLSARVSYLHNENKGYVRNLTPGRTFNFAEPFGTIRSAGTFGVENTDAVAVALRLDLTPVVIDYRFDYSDKISTQLGQQLIGFNPGFASTAGAIYGVPGAVVVGPSTTRLDALALDMTSPSHLRIQGHSLTARYDISDAVSVKSITGFRKLDEFVGGNDIDGGALVDPFTNTGQAFTPISSVEDRHQRQWTQELQLIGKSGGFNWIVGAFYFDERGRDNNPVFVGALFPSGTFTPGAGNPNLFGVPTDYFVGSNSSVHNRSYAGYAHAGLDIGEYVELAGGVRYTKDKRQETVLAAGLIGLASPPASFRAASDHWDFDATATYKFSPLVRAYARFATGYLSGGVLNGVGFKPETANSYEIGLKSDLLNRTLRLNASLFRTDRKNVQTLFFCSDPTLSVCNLPTGPVFGTVLIPLTSARSQGFELEMTAVPTAGMTFGANFGYLDDKLSQSLGPRQSLAPRYTTGVFGQYDLPAFNSGAYISARVDGNFKDKRNSDPVPLSTTAALTELPSRFDLNARLSLIDLPVAGSKVRISGWVQNLTNNRELEFARDLSTAVIGVFQVPRTYGVDLGFRF